MKNGDKVFLVAPTKVVLIFPKKGGDGDKASTGTAPEVLRSEVTVPALATGHINAEIHEMGQDGTITPPPAGVTVDFEPPIGGKGLVPVERLDLWAPY